MKSHDQVINSSEIQGPTTKTDDYDDNYAKDEGVVTDEWLMFCKQQQEEMFKDEMRLRIRAAVFYRLIFRSTSVWCFMLITHSELLEWSI